MNKDLYEEWLSLHKDLKGRWLYRENGSTEEEYVNVARQFNNKKKRYNQLIELLEFNLHPLPVDTHLYLTQEHFL